MDQSQESILREIILNTRKPIVLRNFRPNWKCFDCTIEEWCTRFDASLTNKRLVDFEQMPMKFGDSPQWERYRSNIQLSMTDFLKNCCSDHKTWTAFNYERIDQIPQICRNGIDFNCFGFPNASNDVAFWLGSKGANTPCHYDTYGCNIVVQIYGRKKWLLFSPETELKPTRIPYEESSVYSLENFFSPKNIDSLKGLREDAYECILDKGDVLIVPRNWWHYVENVETSLTVNTWLPLKVDADTQIEECIVKYIVEKNILGESLEEKEHILNPNQLKLISSSEELLKILKFLVDNRTLKETDEMEKYSYQYLSVSDVILLIQKLAYDASILTQLEPNSFDNNMLVNSERYTDKVSVSLIDNLQESLLNAVVHPKVIKIIKDIFLKTYSSNN